MNKKIILIIALLVVVLVALTLVQKDQVMAPQQEAEVEQTQEEQMNEESEPIDLNFTSEDRIFCTETGCQLLSCATGSIEDIEVAEGEVPVKCSDDSELVKQTF